MSLEMPKVYAEARRLDVADIPIIDFGPFLAGVADERARVAGEIGRACETVGFLYLANHGVPERLIERTFAASQRFFDQSPADRMKSAATLEHWRGYVPSKLEGEGGGIGGAIETYRFMLDLPSDDPDVKAGKPLHLPNRWPDNLPGFKLTVEDYIHAMLGLSRSLRHAFAMALGLEEAYFDPFYRRPLFQLHLLHYPPPQSLPA